LQIQEGVDDHLPRAVISDIAAPARAVDGHLRGTEEVGGLAVSADGEDVGMLDHEKDVGKSFPRFSFEEPLLERECSQVIHLPQVAIEKRAHREQTFSFIAHAAKFQAF